MLKERRWKKQKPLSWKRKQRSCRRRNSAITTVLNAIKTAVSTVRNGIKNTITTIVNAIKNAVTTAWNNIKSAVSNAANAIKTGVTNACSYLIEIGELQAFLLKTNRLKVEKVLTSDQYAYII